MVVKKSIHSKISKMTTLGTYIKRSSYKSGLLEKVISENFSDVAEKNVCLRGKTSHAKMNRLSSITFWSLLVRIGGGSGHRRQVFIFDTLLNACVPN